MPNKRLGQHFLQNGAKLQKIADALQIKKGDVVVEIGPGRGELTEKLVAAGAKVFAIEKDAALAAALANKFPRVRTVTGDVREKLPSLFTSGANKKYFIAGNIPYYLTGYLFRLIGELPHKPVRAVFTIQKEVAERIARTDEMGMNILAASILWWADAEYITAVPRKMFSPPPKVDSAVILLRTHMHADRDPQMYADFMECVKMLFAHPRKFAISNLAERCPRELIEHAFARAGIPENSRPGELSFGQIMHIFRVVQDSI
jgi:16S rRNA (adenine1518-N6/adenine1519-N6)-dimethyltransferase